MAESRGINGERALETKHERNGGGGDGTSTLRDSVCAILNSLTTFSNKLKLGADVLKIDADPSHINVSLLQPSDLFTSLQQHISILQTVSANLKQLTKADVFTAPAEGTASEGQKYDTGPISQEAGLASKRVPLTERVILSDPDGKSQVDDVDVQIRASKSEIDRRISAFIERKQLEINENNVREFCNVIDCNQENSCARTDAVFTPFPGFKSHVKVTRVLNTYGPQTRTGGSGDPKDPKRGTVSRDCGNPAVEERLHNIEAHLKLPAEGPVPLNIYQRLKQLEDRILELEGLSPEYFQFTAYLHKRPKVTASQAYSLTELDGKISALKATLLKKAGDFEPTDAEDFPF